MGSLMFVIGGRTNNVGETVPLEVYDCESSEWMKFTSVQRFRHACWLLENTLYIHGGFEQDSPNIPTDAVTKLDVTKFLQAMQGNSSNSTTTTTLTTTTTTTTSTIPIQSSLNKQQTLNPNVNSSLGSGKSLNTNTGMIIEKESTMKDFNQLSKMKKPMNATPNIQNIRISDKVVVATAGMADFDDKDKMIKHVSIDKLQEESKKIKFGGVNFKDPNAFNNNHSLYYESIYNPFISGLLTTTKEWTQPGDKFPFKKDQIIKLIDETIKLFASQPGLLHLRVPAKIYGNIHGQYGDLLRLFENWGTPSERGDIDSFDYLFLGNYVDRGRYSLEVLCLLLSLKLKYPEQFHLLRGSHEDIKVNKAFGFAEECATRLGDDINDYKSVFQRFNELFKFLPLAAVVEGKILCCHAGIGRTLRTLEDIDSLQRPIDISLEPTTTEQNFLMDLLWSDPEPDYGVTQQKYNVPQAATKYDVERLKSFLGDNNLIMLVRSHEVVYDGFERSANGMVMTVFSATDYCGKFQNAAGVVVIKKNFELVPKVINPMMNSSGNFGMDEEKGFKSKLGFGGNGSSGSLSPWMDNEESFKKRPPTPPRSNTKTLKK
jgi:protein phosphatase